MGYMPDLRKAKLQPLPQIPQKKLLADKQLKAAKEFTRKKPKRQTDLGQPNSQTNQGQPEQVEQQPSQEVLYESSPLENSEHFEEIKNEELI